MFDNISFFYVLNKNLNATLVNIRFKTLKTDPKLLNHIFDNIN